MLTKTEYVSGANKMFGRVVMVYENKEIKFWKRMYLIALISLITVSIVLGYIVIELLQSV